MSAPVFYRLADLCGKRKPKTTGLLPLSQNTVLRMVKAGRFPKPVRLGPNSVAWKSCEVLAWVASRNQVAANKARIAREVQP